MGLESTFSSLRIYRAACESCVAADLPVAADLANPQPMGKRNFSSVMQKETLFSVAELAADLETLFRVAADLANPQPKGTRNFSSVMRFGRH